MLELGIDETTFRPLESFKNPKFAVGMKPMVCFTGSLFDSAPEYQLVKSMFLDFFRGETVSAVDVEGLQYMINVSAAEPSDRETKPVVHLRVHSIKTRKSGQKLPRVEVEEIGPRMDFRVRRTQEADAAVMKEALKKPKQLEVRFEWTSVPSSSYSSTLRITNGRHTQARTKKNIETDVIGDKLGRIHTGKQDLNKMQSRKMKGLKRGPTDDEETLVDAEDDKAKKSRLS